MLVWCLYNVSVGFYGAWRGILVWNTENIEHGPVACYFFHPSYHLRSPFSLAVTHIRDHVAGASPPPHYGTCLSFYYEEASALVSLVSRRLASNSAWRTGDMETTSVMIVPTIGHRYVSAVFASGYRWGLKKVEIVFLSDRFSR